MTPHSFPVDSFPVFIVLSNQADDGIQAAAEELVRALTRYTNVLARIVDTDAVPDDPEDVPAGSLWVFCDAEYILRVLPNFFPESPGDSQGETDSLELTGAPFGDGTAMACLGSNTLSSVRALFLLGEQLGLRYLLFEDIGMEDMEPVPFDRMRISIQAESQTRGVCPGYGPLLGPVSWDADDYVSYVVQLVKQGANMLVLDAFGNEPFLPGDARYERFARTALPNSMSPRFGYRPVRPADLCYGAELFESPDVFGSAASRAVRIRDRFAAAQELWKQAIETARRFGMTIAVRIHPLDVAPELLDELPADQKDLDGLIPSLESGAFERLLEERIRLAVALYDPDYIWIHRPDSPVFSGIRPALQGALSDSLDTIVGTYGENGLTGGEVAFLQMVFCADDILQRLAATATLVLGGWSMAGIISRAHLALPDDWILCADLDSAEQTSDTLAVHVAALEATRVHRVWWQINLENPGRMLEPQTRLRRIESLFEQLGQTRPDGLIMWHRRRAECAETMAYALQALWGEGADSASFHEDMAVARYGQAAGIEIARANLILEGIDEWLIDEAKWLTPSEDSGIPLIARMLRLVGWGRPMSRPVRQRVRLRYEQALETLDRLARVVQLSSRVDPHATPGFKRRHTVRWRSRIGAMRDIYRSYRQVLKAALILDEGMTALVSDDDYLAAIRSVKQAVDEAIKAPVRDIQKHLARSASLPEDKAALISVQCKWIDPVDAFIADLKDILDKSAAFNASITPDSIDPTGFGDLIVRRS